MSIHCQLNIPTVLIVLSTTVFITQGAGAVRGIYVNNHKIEKFEVDRINIFKTTGYGSTNVNKNALLRIENFTNVHRDKQSLHSEVPIKYLDLLLNKTKSPIPLGATDFATSNPYGDPEQPGISYADDLSAIKNTLNNTDLSYLGDYQRIQLAQSIGTTALPPFEPIVTKRTPAMGNRKRKKKPTPSTRPSPTVNVSTPSDAIAVSSLDVNKTKLTPETFSLLSRFYTFSCTLTPIKPSPALTNPTDPPSKPVGTTSKTKTRRLTTRAPITTTRRPKSTPVPAKQRKPVVYVDPPVIKRIGGILESVYKFVENAFTSTEYVGDSEETRAAVSRLDVEDKSMADPNEPNKNVKVKRNTLTLTSEDSPEFVNSASEEKTSRATLPQMGQTWLPLSNDASAKITKEYTPKLVTISALPSTLSSDGNKNKMTTNIQVTSEYTAATPPTVTLGKPRPSESEEYDDSSEDESEEEYFEGFVSFGDGDDDSDEDDDETEEEITSNVQYVSDGSEPSRPNRQTILANDKDYDEDSTHIERPVRIKRVKKRRRKKHPTSSYEDTAEYSDQDGSEEDDDEYDDRDESAGVEDDDDYDESGEPPEDAEGFFSQMFATFGRFVRSFGFGTAARGTPGSYDDYDGDRSRSTTPRVLDVRRRPTRSTSEGAVHDAQYYHQNSDLPITVPPASIWNPFNWKGISLPDHLKNIVEQNNIPSLEEEDDEEVLPTAEIPASTTDSSSWFDLVMPWDFKNPWTSNESSEAASGESSKEQNSTVMKQPTSEQEMAPTAAGSMFSGWLSQLLGGGTTSSFLKPSKPTTVAPDSEQVLLALAQYVVQTATTSRPSSVTVSKPTKQPSRTMSYEGYQLWRIFSQTEDQLEKLLSYRRSKEGLHLHWWSGPSLLGPTDVLVPPNEQAEHLREYLEDEEIRHEPTIRDLKRAIAFENPQTTRREQKETELIHGHPLTWYRYHQYSDIMKFMYFLQRHHPQHVQLLHIGRSYEGRPLTVARVFFNSSSQRSHQRRAKKQPAIFIEAGAHGQQWIGPAVATWLLNRLLDVVANKSQYSESAELKAVQSYDWYILPVLNPDGYEYSHKHDRMWAKSRSRIVYPPPGGVAQGILSSAMNWWHGREPLAAQAENSRTKCYGVDLNHNWAYRWDEMTEPEFRNDCSDHFAGTGPFSEPETRALRKFLLTGRRDVRLYLSLQAYGQVLSYPEPDSFATSSMDYDRKHVFSDVHDMAAAGMDAMRREAGDSVYSLEVDSGPHAYGTAAGYARHGAGIRYSYTLSLPDTGTHGFLLPPSNIVAIGRDTFELLRGMIDNRL